MIYLHYLINKSYSPDSPIPPRRMEIIADECRVEPDGTRVFINRMTGAETRIPATDIYELDCHV